MLLLLLDFFYPPRRCSLSFEAYRLVWVSRIVRLHQLLRPTAYRGAQTLFSTCFYKVERRCTYTPGRRVVNSYYPGSVMAPNSFFRDLPLTLGRSSPQEWLAFWQILADRQKHTSVVSYDDLQRSHWQDRSLGWRVLVLYPLNWSSCASPML
jgi:hypothetical protein